MRQPAQVTITRMCPGWAHWYSLRARVIARSTLTRFIERLRNHGAVKAALAAWFHEVVRAHWMTPADVKRSYGNASIVDAERVVFNIKGNDYRLVAAVDYRRQIIFMK